MTVEALIARLPSAKRNSSGWQAKCPAHEDGNPSLSIDEGEDGRILLKCHAGCTAEEICKKLGLTLKDLYPMRNNEGKRHIAAEYDYTDESGKQLFQTIRFEPKGFRQRQSDGKGGWIWNIKGVRLVPFRIPKVIQAVKQGRPIYVCEGEKDVLALEKAGFTATCNPMGAGKWRDTYSHFFKGADVRIIADKDDTGRKHAADVAQKISGIAASVKTIELPETNGKTVKDAADYFAAGGEAADLDELAQTAKPFDPANAADALEEGETENPWLALVEDGALITAKELPSVVQIVEGIVCEQSKLVICSSAKCFKTWLTIMLSLCISAGVPFLGRPTQRRRVLYVNLELKPATFDRRLQVIAQSLGITIDATWFEHLPLRGRMAGLSLSVIISRLIALCRHFEASVIVIDPLFKLNIEGEENSTRDQTVFFVELDRLTTEAGCTAILNDHSTKGNQSEKEPLDVIRGSSAKGGDLDAAMVLRKHEVENCFRVDMVHRELPPVDPFVLGWRYPVMELRADLDAEAMKKSKGGRNRAHDPQKLCVAIADSTREKPVSISAWATAARVPRPTLIGYLPELRTLGWIATVGEGSAARQYLTPEGRKAASKNGDKE